MSSKSLDFIESNWHPAHIPLVIAPEAEILVTNVTAVLYNKPHPVPVQID